MHLAQGLAGRSIRIAHTALDDWGNEQVSEHEDFSFEPCSKALFSRWNGYRAFAAFLRREGDRERGMLRRYLPDSLFDNSRHSTLVPSSSPTLHLSSDAEGSEPDTDYSSFSASYFFSDPSPFPMITPYPSHPLHRKRVERVERRMEQLTKSGMSVLSSDEEEDKKKKRRRRKKPSEEVLEWSDDADGEDEGEGEEEPDTKREEVLVEEIQDEEEEVLEGDWLRVEELVEEEDDRYGPDWDPFGDEEEV